MEQEKKSFKEWIKEHKTELILSGVSIAALIAVIFGIKSKKELMEIWESLISLVKQKPAFISRNESQPVIVKNPVSESIKSFAPITRCPHYTRLSIRNLPEGWHASPEKIRLAGEMGLKLAQNQTWVVPYNTGSAA